MSRLPLELWLLVIDVAAIGRAAGSWDDGYIGCRMRTLKACSLVCKAWYRHTIPHIWASITVAIESPTSPTHSRRDPRTATSWGWCMARKERRLPLADVLAIFRSNSNLMAAVCHVRLEFSRTLDQCQPIPAAELLAFCKELAPLPRFSWKAQKIHHDTIFTPSYEVADNDDHPIRQTLTLFCNSPTLTTFAFSGREFFFDILKAMPNLKDLSFIDVWRCITPYSLANKPYLFQPLPFICKPYIFA